MSWYCSNPTTDNELWDMAHPDPREMATMDTDEKQDTETEDKDA